MSRLSKKLPVIAAMFLAMVGGPSSMAITQEAPLPVTQEQSILADLPEGVTVRFDDKFVYFPDGSKMSLEHCRNTGTP